MQIYDKANHLPNIITKFLVWCVFARSLGENGCFSFTRAIN